MAFFKREPAAPAEHYEVEKPEAEWRRALSPEQFRVLREHGTERPGSSPLNGEKRPGTFLCAACGKALFDAGAKYESGTGWPSFWAPIDEKAVGTHTDRSLFMTPDGGALRALRRASRPRLPGRAEADRAALLHERRWPCASSPRGASRRRRRHGRCAGRGRAVSGLRRHPVRPRARRLLRRDRAAPGAAMAPHADQRRLSRRQRAEPRSQHPRGRAVPRQHLPLRGGRPRRAVAARAADASPLVRQAAARARC